LVEALFPTAAGFFLVLLRSASLCMVAPLFGTRSVPARIRLSLALVIGAVAFTAAGGPRFIAWERADALVTAAVGETAIGLCAGLAAKFVLDAVNGAGQAMGISMGLGFGAVIDPIHGAESTAISELLALLALGVAVGAGIHREAVAWLCRSVALTPPGTDLALAEMAARVVAEATRASAIAVRLAFPVMTAVTFGHLGLGLVSRTAPQLNLSNIGFSVAILAGGGALYLAAPVVADAAAQAAREAFLAR
jgi:flagellar biosynthesis protein FliR